MCEKVYIVQYSIKYCLMPLLRRLNPGAHPLVLDTLIRAKWFELMNTEEEEEEKQCDLEEQEGTKRKQLVGAGNMRRVKKIKLNVGVK